MAASASHKRYKPWRLFKRRDAITLPKAVLKVDITESAGETLSEEVENFSSICCNFAPDDNQIFTSLGTFNHYVRSGRIPCGFLSVWEIDDGKIFDLGCMFTYAPVPYPLFSSCGNLCCAIMNGFQGQLSVVGYSYKDKEKLFGCTPLPCIGGNLCGKSICLVVDHTHAVTITDLKMQNKLVDCVFSMWKVQGNLMLKHFWMKKLDQICEHLSSGDYLMQCMFSPCSNYVALLMSDGHFTITDVCDCEKKEFTSRTVNLLPLIGVENRIKQKIIFSFNPFGSFQIILIGYNKTLFFINHTNAKVQKQHLNLLNDNECITHVKYSNNGAFLAVCSSYAKVYIFSPLNEYNLLYVLSSFDVSEGVSANYASFSSSSQELIVSSSAGLLTVWQLPRMTKLKEICRLKLLTCITRDDIENLDIPENLRQYLYFRHL
ncbi:uncharacterized protein LOC130658025 [Hydractinia symbiolongicarpus]|uniref:uncharacterized protein LOC130658025 n=1 Tax=Hydractinia symbiolongicarpus TaxID=13093 RepID=UPI00255018A9|nr:uncharacterized protein LOC130658025 [Hydractinia symbiolongicarpus]